MIPYIDTIWYPWLEKKKRVRERAESEREDGRGTRLTLYSSFARSVTVCCREEGKQDLKDGSDSFNGAKWNTCMTSIY